MSVLIEYRWSVDSGIIAEKLGEIYETHVFDSSEQLAIVACILTGITQGFDVNIYHVEDT